MEKIVEIKTCKFCNYEFEITDRDLEFYDKVSPVFSGKKYNIPTPTLCPDCRQQRRLSFRNERKLYKRKCDLSGKEIISIYSPDKPYKVYDQKEWWSDKWDSMDYGKDFDFSRGFFEQFDELMKKIPRLSLGGFGNENSEYTNLLANSHNCYFTISGVDLEDIYYSFWMARCKNIIDSIRCFDSSLLYNCIDCHNCHNSSWLFRSNDCIDSIYLHDCIGCKNCIASVGLRNASYYIGNIKYNSKDYAKKLKELKISDIKKLYEEIYSKKPVLCTWIYNCDLCIGDQLVNSKSSIKCFDSDEIEKCKYLTYGLIMNNCMDVDYDSETHYTIEEIVGYQLYNAIGVNYCSICKNIIYCTECLSCNNCFGCIGLNNKQYCILNKQYTKEEYEKLVPKIIEHMMKTGEWGEFFPSWMSPFGYNETVAMEYYPETPPSIPPLPGEGGRFKWSDYEPPFPKVEKIIPASKLPDNIKDIPDDILNWAIECEVTKKPFRIIAQELEFYRKHNLPIPRIHPDQRHLDRMSLRNPRKLFDRKCDKCGKDIKTTYSRERKEIVYCEECYNREIY